MMTASGNADWTIFEGKAFHASRHAKVRIVAASNQRLPSLPTVHLGVRAGICGADM